MRHVTLISLFVVATGFAACSSPPPPPPAAPAGKPVDPATAGSVTGHVSFDGARPAVEIIRMNMDPACMQNAGTNNSSDTALISPDGSLQNVFVYVKDAFDGYAFDVPAEKVVLDQRGCRYAPHVFGVRAGQPIEIINDDQTLHNVHAMPMKNQEFNQGQPVSGSRMTKTFTVPEVMVPFKCNVHAWMTAYVGVMAHPFFAVTAADGKFSLTGIPPGTYTVEAWHEKFGTRTQQVTIGPSQAQTTSFSFTSAAK